ncbi:MAG: hypothetical protein NVSMB67_11690 [Flavisolibacter sp.]
MFVKRYSLAWLGGVFSLLLFVSISCKKINSATDLGSDLIPGVDNINTFETSLNTQTTNAFFNDTISKLYYIDPVAIGSVNDPEFGSSKADAYFNISSRSYGNFPFKVDRANVGDTNYLKIDSVVLSLAYLSAYGDSNSLQKVHIYEIANNNSFSDSTLYSLSHADFPTIGSELGNASYIPARLKDSAFIQRTGKIGDSIKVANLLRIKFFDNSLAQRFANFDTATGTANNGFASDAAFKSLFRGFAIKAENATGNGALSYFSLADIARTKLTIYFKAKRNGVTDTTAIDFIHFTNGQANLINRNPSGNYANYLATGPLATDRIYLQSSPGSYAAFKIPSLETLGNKVVHRAEIIAAILPSSANSLFTPPSRLMLDRINQSHDTAFLFEKDFTASLSGSLDFVNFGGAINQTRNNYVFNITRYIQEILTRRSFNDSLRLYAPLRASVFAKNVGRLITIPILSKPGEGRVVLAGGNYPDPSLKLRLRIIYSNL